MRAQKLLFLLLFSFIAVDAVAQQARNGAYFELGGSGVVPTLNYERRVSERWIGRVGFSYVESSTIDDGETVDSDSSFVFPLTASWVGNPEANHHLELGGGVTIATGDRHDLFEIGDDDEEFSAVFLTGIIGYRYQKPGRGFLFRATGTPVMSGGEVLPWLGVTFGYVW